LEEEGGAVMKFRIEHCNINVLDLAKSIAFYKEALGLEEVRRIEAPDGSFVLVFVADEARQFSIELTWLRDHKEPYDLGDNESHIAFRPDDFPGAHAMHSKMGCICYENTERGLYFINDPDGYWLEILPQRKA
jgi:lactoylglutathione lyase